MQQATMAECELNYGRRSGWRIRIHASFYAGDGPLSFVKAPEHRKDLHYRCEWQLDLQERTPCSVV
jgi:hypothetical protein